VVDQLATRDAHLAAMANERRSLLEERAARLDGRIDSTADRCTEGLAGLERQISVAMDGQQRAAAITEVQQAEWRKSANEWRGAMSDRDRLLVPRDTYDTMTVNQAAQLADLQARLTLAEGKAAGAASSLSLVLSVAAVLLAVVMATVAILALNN
jgi:hypothetical protein